MLIDWLANTTMFEKAQWNTVFVINHAATRERQEHTMFACGCELATAQTTALQCVHKYAMSAHQLSACHASDAPLPDSLLALFSSQNRAIRPFALLGSRTRMTRCLTQTGHDRESVPAVGAQVAEFWLGLHPRHETCANAWTTLSVCNSNCR